MSELAGRKVVEIAGLEFTVKELTVAEVRRLLLPTGEADLLGDALFSDLRLRDLQLMTNLTAEQIEAMLPSQVHEVIMECKGMNKHFFEMTGRLV